MIGALTQKSGGDWYNSTALLSALSWQTSVGADFRTVFDDKTLFIIFFFFFFATPPPKYLTIH